MSDQQNTMGREAALEGFLDLYDASRSFEALVMSLFSMRELFAIKELGASEFEAASRVFFTLCEWDAEGMSQDVIGTIKCYIEAHK